MIRPTIERLVADPAMADCMTVAQVLAEARSIAATIGPKAEIFVSVSASRYSTGQVSVSVYPDQITQSLNSENFRADTWRAALDEARAWASSQGTLQREAAIRRMALLVIDLTDQHGECAEGMLVRQGFTSEQVRELHATACERAGEMCHGAPFSVVLA